MTVDISANLPPSSSCTGAAEFGEGFHVRGSAAPGVACRTKPGLVSGEQHPRYAMPREHVRTASASPRCPNWALRLLDVGGGGAQPGGVLY